VDAALAADRRTARPVLPLPRPHLRAAPGRLRTWCSGPRKYGENLRQPSWAPATCFGAQSHPEKSSGARGLALLANFTRLCRPGDRMILFPRHRHLRGQGRSGWSRATSTRRPSIRTRRSRPRAARGSEGRGRGSCTIVDLDGRERSGSPKKPATTSSRSPTSCRSPSSAAAACAGSAPWPRTPLRGRRGAGHPRHGPPSPTSTLPRRRASAPSARRVIRLRRHAGRHGVHERVADHDAECPPRRSSSACRTAAVRSFVYTNVDRDGMLGGPDPSTRLRRIAAVVRGRFIYSGGIGQLSDLEGPRRPAPGQPRRRDRRQGAVRRPLHDRPRARRRSTPRRASRA